MNIGYSVFWGKNRGSFERLSNGCSVFWGEKQGLVPLAGSNNESWCQGLDGLDSRAAAYYQQGARFAKWYRILFLISVSQRLKRLNNGGFAGAQS